MQNREGKLKTWSLKGSYDVYSSWVLSFHGMERLECNFTSIVLIKDKYHHHMH